MRIEARAARGLRQRVVGLLGIFARPAVRAGRRAMQRTPVRPHQGQATLRVIQRLFIRVDERHWRLQRVVRRLPRIHGIPLPGQLGPPILVKLIRSDHFRRDGGFRRTIGDLGAGRVRLVGIIIPTARHLRGNLCHPPGPPSGPSASGSGYG